ncbi:MAG TPA: transaldolase, partial [Longimicrobiaceae bacterium]|nr:transaldolase [Longimicrobiaceae bacterium]
HAVRGVTSNPAIFEQAIAQSDDYDDALERLVAEGRDATEVYEILAIEDIQSAADILRPVYDESQGTDGFVSLEVSPELANDTEGTLEEARRLWQTVERPNVMIKVPGTDAGIPAVEQLLFEGLNVNITLLFSLEGYERVMEAYLRGLERRAEAGEPVHGIASVASFFVSRVDTAVDAQLEKLLEQTQDEERRKKIRSLFGKAAIANAKLAYQRFQEKICESERFARLRDKGAHVQRPLWASTSTKNPEYRDVIYVEELIGPDTVNTMPLKTLQAFADHGEARRTVDADVEQARADLAALAELGIDLDRVTTQVQEEGVEKFVTPFRSLLQSIEEKLTEVAGRA